MGRRPSSKGTRMRFDISGAIWFWRGLAPYHFLAVPEAKSNELKAMVSLLTYGWGMIPVQAQISQTRFTTSLFHKDGIYVLPIKVMVRKAEGVEEGDHVMARIEIQVRV